MWIVIIVISAILIFYFSSSNKSQSEYIQNIKDDITDAEKAIENQKYELALDRFKRIFSNHPTVANEIKAHILIKMSFCASELKKSDDSIAFLNEAERYNSDVCDIYLLRASAMLSKKDTLSTSEIKSIENDLRRYSNMNPYEQEDVQKMNTMLRIRKEEVFSSPKEVSKIPVSSQKPKVRAIEDSYIFQQQQGDKYYESGDFQEALNCYKCAYMLYPQQIGNPIGRVDEIQRENIALQRKIAAGYFSLDKYDEAVDILDDILDEIGSDSFFCEFRAYCSLASENFNTLTDFLIVKEDINCMKDGLETNSDKNCLKTYNMLRFELGRKLVNCEDQSWRNNAELLEFEKEFNLKNIVK